MRQGAPDGSSTLYRVPWSSKKVAPPPPSTNMNGRRSTEGGHRRRSSTNALPEPEEPQQGFVFARSTSNSRYSQAITATENETNIRRKTVNQGRSSRKTTKPVVSQPRAEKNRSSVADAASNLNRVLMDDTKKMEDRLRMLRVAMREEEYKLKSIAKRPDGAIWRSARPVKGKNYKDNVVSHIKQRKHRKRSSKAPVGASPPKGKRDSAQSETKTSVPLSASYPDPVEATAYQPPSGAPIEHRSQSRLSENSYVPPVTTFRSRSRLDVEEERTEGTHGPTSIPVPIDDQFEYARAQALNLAGVPDLSGVVHDDDNGASNASGGNLLSGSFDEEASSSWFQQARADFLQGGVDESKETHLQSPDQDETRTHNGGGLLLGDTFDEEASADWFKKARNDFLQSLGGDEPHDGNSYSSTISMEGSTAVVDGPSLLDGVFNEEESSKSFAAARAAFLSGVEQTAAKKVEPQPPATGLFSLSATHVNDSGDSMASMLFGESVGPTDQVEGTDASEKRCCYECFRVFYALPEEETEVVSQTYCSEECSDAASKVLPTLVCRVCSSSMQLGQGTLYCSVACLESELEKEVALQQEEVEAELSADSLDENDEEDDVQANEEVTPISSGPVVEIAESDSDESEEEEDDDYLPTTTNQSSYQNSTAQLGTAPVPHTPVVVYELPESSDEEEEEEEDED